MIVNLTVDDDNVAGRGIDHRLRTGWREIENRETCIA